jgi:hypothetical protein
MELMTRYCHAINTIPRWGVQLIKTNKSWAYQKIARVGLPTSLRQATYDVFVFSSPLEGNSPSYDRRVAHYGAHQIFTIIFYKYVVPTGHEIQPHLQLKLLLYVP